MHERPLRVFYNASAVPGRPAGAGIYTLELAAALQTHAGVELLVAGAAPEHAGLGSSGASYTATAPPGLPRRLIWEHIAIPPVLRARKAELYHGPHMFIPRTPVPAVATIHDLTFWRMPRRYDAAHRWYYRYLARTAKRATKVIVPTAAAASDVVRYLGYPPEHVRVIHEAPRSWLRPAPAAGIQAVRERYSLEDRYLLCLGTAEPGKRAVDALRAMPAILERVPRTSLALAGNPGRLSAALEAEAVRLGVRDRVRFLGYVADEDLAALLTGAAALVFPSLFEGFGLPPLEAMACGTPVISSDAPAMREVLGGAALFVPLRDPARIARHTIELLESPALREELRGRGLDQAARYSWARAAGETLEVYREAAG